VLPQGRRRVEVDRAVVEADPTGLRPYLDAFVESPPFDELEDDWIWLTAAFLSEAILETSRARWDMVESSSGRAAPVPRVHGYDGKNTTRHCLSTPPTSSKAPSRFHPHAGRHEDPGRTGPRTSTTTAHGSPKPGA
jgi:hypothetical protein